jgi:class 3 adenylate cyclase
LNGHFSLLAECIEAEDGTLDKFIGDSVMAFWATPFNTREQVACACRAALAIRDAVSRDNRARGERGEEPIRVRIGIHTGRAIVGNIGAPGRINYTVVGDTVNLAQRLEELGKTTWSAGEDAIILVSGDVADALGDEFELTARGSQEIRGREGGLRVFRLESGQFNDPEPEPESDSDTILELTVEPPAYEAKQPEPDAQPTNSPPRDLDQAARAYNPAVQAPTPPSPLSIGSMPESDGPKSVSLRPKSAPARPLPAATPNPIDNGDDPIEPQVAPPGSPAASRYGAKDPKGFEFDWDIESIEIDKKKDDDASN